MTSAEKLRRAVEDALDDGETHFAREKARAVLRAIVEELGITEKDVELMFTWAITGLADRAGDGFEDIERTRDALACLLEAAGDE